MHYTSPYLEETLCFANIAKSHHRYVCSYDWYPALAGLIVASYTFTTAATLESSNIEKSRKKFLFFLFLTFVSEQVRPILITYNETS